MSLKEKLIEIDLYLEIMPKNNRKMVYASFFLGFIAFSYYFIGVGLQEEAEAKEKKVSSLEKSLEKNQLSLYQSKISNKQKKILFLDSQYEEAMYKETKLKVKLERMDYLSSDAKGLADILDRLLKESVRLGVKIEKILIDNEEKDYKAYIKQKGTIRIEGNATFRSVLKLLRFIESQEALIEVKNIHFGLEQANKTPSFVIMITGYGISI